MKKLIAVLMVCAVSMSAAAMVLVNDTFTDGGRTNGTDALDADWWMVAGDTTLTVQNDDGTPGIGGGNALAATHTADIRQIVGNFDEVTLSNIGESITMSFDFRILNSPLTNSATDFRFGLFNDWGTKVTGDLLGNTNDDQGYYVRASTGVENKWTLTRDKGTETLLGGSDMSGILDDLTFGGITDNNLHTAELILTRNDEGSIQALDIEFVLDKGTVGEKWMIEDHRGTSAVFTFNEIAFASYDDNINYILDNVTVSHTVPEPATLALLAFGGIVTLMRRKRR